MNRRTLLRSAAIATSATLLPIRLFASTPTATASPIRLGIASYTFRNFDSAQLMGFMKTLRSPYLNLKDMHLKMGSPSEVAAAAKAYRDAGFQLTAAGTINLDVDTDEDMRPKFEYFKAAGIRTMVASPTLEALPRVERFVKEYDIQLAIHNHGPEDKKFPSPYDVLAAVKTLDPRMGLCIDVGHAMRAGADVPAAIRAAGPRLFDVHIKDLANAKERDSQVAVGEGLMSVREIFRALIEIQYPGNVDLEYEIFPKDPLPGVIESFAYMRGVLAGMGYQA